MMCNASDLGTKCANPHETRNIPKRLLLYDQHPGGIGLSVQIQRLFRELLTVALELISTCSCVLSSKVPGVRPGPGLAKSGSNKKTQRVTFQETPSLSEKSKTDTAAQDNIVCMPVFPIKPLIQETPYHSAENCRKCRLDSLEISSYWLAWIKFAGRLESILCLLQFSALAWNAKCSLQIELKNYRARHGAVSLNSLWDDLCLDYGLTSDNSDGHRIDTVLVEQIDSKSSIEEEVNFIDCMHNCLDYVIIDKPEVILEDLDAIKAAPEESVHVEYSRDGTPAPSSSMNSPHKNCKDVEFPGFMRSFKITGKTLRYGDHTSNDSAENKATSKPNISGKKGEQAETKIYDC